MDTEPTPRELTQLIHLLFRIFLLSACVRVLPATTAPGGALAVENPAPEQTEPRLRDLGSTIAACDLPEPLF